MNWYRIDIEERCVLGGAYHSLCRAFQQAFIHAGAPPDMALFAQTYSFDNRRQVYLSPGSRPRVPELLEAYGARPAQPPDATEVSLVFGAPGAEGLLAAAPAPLAA